MISAKLEYQILGCALPLTWRSQQEIIGPRLGVLVLPRQAERGLPDGNCRRMSW
jgi:hypothetical protein